MAFQSMVSGAECSTGASPLASLLKQQNNDTSLHQSSFQQQQGGPSQSIRTRNGTPMGQNEEAERFFQMNNGGGGGGSQANYSMEAMRRELENTQRDGALKGDREWASQYRPASANALNPVEMAQMEERFRQQSRPNDLSAEYWSQQQSSAGPSYSSAPELQQHMQQSQQQKSGFAPAYGAYSGGMGMGMGMRSMGMGMGGMGGIGMNMMNNQQFSNMGRMDEPEVIGKGKGRFVELNDEDWEAQFAKAGEAVQGEPTTMEAAQIEDQIHSGVDLSDTTNLLDGEIDLDATEDDAELMKSLEKTWSNLQSTLNQSSISDSEMAAWEAQYGSQFADLNGDSGLGDDLNYGGINPSRQWTMDNVDSFLTNDEAYPFAEENVYLGHPDPFGEGQRLLAAGAPLSQAALAFEAACQLDNTRGEAWKAAGETWAADEREVKGIRALEKAVACGGADGVGAWMSLAVAYVNEGQELRALATLERWLSLAYPTISLPPATNAGQGPWDTSNRVIDLFLSAARAGPTSRAAGQSNELTEVDPDVQVGLGVLFYSNSDYLRARDCFDSALSVRPTDFLLWNRLGATLANGGNPEEAISAYRRALDIRPTFTRATYNLGVSCLNIGCYQEAAEHLLAAIEGQNIRESNVGKKNVGSFGGVDVGGEGEEDGSANLWQTLRRAFLCMERHDLAEKAHAGTPTDEFRREGFEF